MKVKLSTVNKNIYDHEVKPSVIQLQSGEACEFETSITSLFTTNILTEISLVSLCFEQGKEYTDSIVVDATSEPSIKIDPD